MGHDGEFWQNVVHWRREWQTTSVLLTWEPHEQYEKAKRYNKLGKFVLFRTTILQFLRSEVWSGLAGIYYFWKFLGIFIPFICFSQFLESAPIFWLAVLHHFNLCFHCYISFLLWCSWPPLIRTLEITETHLYDQNSLPF